MKDYFLWASIVLNVVLALIVWNDRFRWRNVIAEYETETRNSDAIKKAAYNPKEFRK